MKKAALYLLFFTYSTFVCKPLLPLISDCVAHIFWYSEHVATVHYEHGKYHVHYESMDAAKKNLPEKNTVIKYDETSCIHPITKIDAHTNLHFTLKKFNKFLPLSPTAGFTGALFLPPKA